MARSACVLLEETDGWYLGAIDGGANELNMIAPRSTTGAALAMVVHEQCQLRGFGKTDLVVAVHADSVVFAAFPDAADPTPRDRAALLFQLEPELPFDAEDVVADFAGSDGNLVAVAVRHASLLAFVSAVEDHGLRVQSLVPAALAALQNIANTDGAFVWRRTDAVELVSIRNDDLHFWRHLPGDAKATARELRVRGLSTPVLISDSDSDPDYEADEFAQAITAGATLQSSLAAEVTQFATRLLSGHASPWIELRRGALANGDPNRPFRSSLNLLTVAGFALLVLFIAACWWRAAKFNDEAQRYAQQQRELYKSAFPGKRLPRAPMSRLRSEHAKLLGARGAGEVQLPVSVVEPTYQVLTGLKPHRARVSELRVHDGGFDLTVQMKDFNDVAALKRSMEAQGFAVELGSQDTDSDGFVATTLKGQPVPDSTGEAKP